MFSIFLIIIGVVFFLVGVLGMMAGAEDSGVLRLWLVGLFFSGTGILIKDVADNKANVVEKTNQPITIVMKCPHCGLPGMAYTNVVTKTQTVENPENPEKE